MPTDVANAVIYVRAPAPLKEVVDAYARERSLTLAGAVTNLLERGLEAVSNESSVTQLQTRMTQLERELEIARTESSHAAGTISALRLREHEFLSLTQRAEQPLGPCPHCGKPVRGIDVLITQRCPMCGSGLSSVLVGQTKGFNQTELLVLLGVLGILAGAAYVQSKSAS